MASNTPKLGLYMKDPVADGNDFFDVKTMMNDNWEKIDGFAGGMDEVKERLNTISRQDVTLNAGVQTFNATKGAPFKLSGLTGRMLVNLLGRLGSCESVGLWSSNTTIAVDTANKTSGTSSFKLTLGSVPATASASFLTTPGRKYVAIADVKNGNTSKVAISINGIAGATGNEVTSASAFAPSVVRFAATDFFHIVTITGTGASGNTFNMDSVRVYEVSDADYAAAASYTPAQAAAKWPYVDSVMPVRNPYVIRYGENLLPSFYEWTVTTSGIVTVQGPNKATAVRATADIIAPLKVVVPVLPNTTYTMSSVGDGLQYIERRDSNDSDPSGEVATGVVVVGAKTFTTSAQTSFLSVRLRYASVGTFSHENPMLNIGSTAKPFKPHEDSMLALQTDLYADPVTGADADSVFEQGGQYFKNKNYQRQVIDGLEGWTLSPISITGAKRVEYNHNRNFTPVRQYGTKYDGRVLTRNNAPDTADNFIIASNITYIVIPNADSGWGDSYTPTADEIKAYFMGWIMYDGSMNSGNDNPDTPAGNMYKGTGTKAWCRRTNGVTRSFSDPTATLPTTLAPKWTPYELVYQLATPTVEPIVSEGQLSFNEGDNQVEVGTGIVVREPNRTYQEAAGGWNINNGTPGWEPSLLKYKAASILAVYKNNKKDDMWRLDNSRPTVAGALAQQLNVDHDIAAAYSVTYLMLDRSPAVPVTGSYAANEKTLLADLVDGVQQNTARVSVLENKKADKDSPAWIAPTLINGVVLEQASTPVGYKKQSDGLVVVQGSVKPPSTGAIVAFKLPVGYRPSQQGAVMLLSGGTSTTTDVIVRCVVTANGDVQLTNAVAVTWVRLDGLKFIAEQ